MPVYVGTAGWALPRGHRDRFPLEGPCLARYAARLTAAEINSTFYRAHRASTYERWAATVPRGFRFCVKLRRTITHEHRLVGTRRLVEAFLEEIAPLGVKMGCLLVQLPPSLEMRARTARSFFSMLRQRYEGPVAFEPRHASWFGPDADRMLEDLEVARVAADPPRAAGAVEPGGWPGIAYFRLHGSPRMYFSPYGEAFLARIASHARALSRSRTPCWCIFDNTGSGAAAANALDLAGLLARPKR
jgi:uncharacterized protein YecE (DUF72 family)